MLFSWYGVMPVLSPLLNDLSIIRLRQLDDDPTKLNFQTSKPLVLQSGQAVSPEKKRFDREDLDEYGTLGFFLYMETDDSSKHLAATVGHVLGDSGKLANLSTLPGEEKISTATLSGCERTLGRPRFWCLSRPALNEICLLDAPPPSDQISVSCVIKGLDCNKISSICPVSSAIKNDPDSAWIPKQANVEGVKKWIDHNGPLFVYNIDATAEETVGMLFKVQEIRQRLGQLSLESLTGTLSSSSSSSSSSSELPQDETQGLDTPCAWSLTRINHLPNQETREA